MTITGRVLSRDRQTIEEIETFLAGGGIAGVIQIHHDRVEVARFDGIDDAGRRVDGFSLIALSLNQEAERLQHIRLVVGYQDPRYIRIGKSHGAVNNIVACVRQLPFHSKLLRRVRIEIRGVRLWDAFVHRWNAGRSADNHKPALHVWSSHQEGRGHTFRRTGPRG